MDDGTIWIWILLLWFLWRDDKPRSGGNLHGGRGYVEPPKAPPPPPPPPPRP